MPPLTPKGRKIMRSMKKTYGPEEGERVFYASRNAHRIAGVDSIDPIHRYMDAVRRGDAQGMKRALKK